MDFKNNDKSKIVPQPNTSDAQNYFTESNAGHISVQTISPFRMRGSEYATGQSLKCKTERSSNFFGKKPPKDSCCSSATSKLLIKQIIREHNLDGDSLLKEGHADANHHRHRIEKTCNYSQSLLINHVEFKHSAPTINSKYSSMRLGLCSREETIDPAADEQCANSERRIYSSNSIFQSKQTEQKQYAEKTTYCRPVSSINKEFVNKTAARNIRLQQLVNKLVIARKRERETEALNNYINELKTRHGIDRSESERIYLPQTHEYTQVDSIDYGKSMLSRSSKCNDLLEEFYGASDAEQHNKCSCNPAQYCQQCYCDNTYQCYPMSSQGRFMMLKKERRNPFSQDWQYHTPRSRQFRGNTIVVGKEKTDSRQLPRASRSIPYRRNSSIDSYQIDSGTNSQNYSYEQKFREFATQTSIEISPGQELMIKRGETFVKDTLQEQYRVTENVDRLKKKIQETVQRKVNEETVQREGTSVLRSIENKLDTLIKSLNSFFYEASPGTSDEQCYYCHSLHFNRHRINNMNFSRSYTFGLNKTERLVCGLLTENSIKPFKPLNRSIAEKTFGTDINKLLIHEIDTSNKVKNEIENILNHDTLKQRFIDNPIATKEEEDSSSLSKSLLRFQDKSVSMKKISMNGSGDVGKITIAVNTDPLGLLALLKISTETMKQYLSYMPNFPYHTYLQMIQFPQTRQAPDFVCNICGAAFKRPSQLSDHIQGHDLRRTRDCCVCRHILDMQSQRSIGLFRCQYCGQRFTRAYCCELHQETCAKRFGLKHDITPSLMLLR